MNGDKETPSGLVNWRLSTLERDVMALQKTVDQLATKEDVELINKKLDHAAEKKDDRSFAWLNTVVAPTISGLIVGAVLLAASALAHVPHVP